MLLTRLTREQVQERLIALHEASVKERVQQAIDGLNHVIRDLRSYILDLRPRQLGNDGLISGLRRLVTEFRANTFAEAYLSGPEKELVHLPQGHALAVFHIYQEALANAAKHAEAKNIQITLWTTDERVLMEIHNDGRGFEMGKMSSAIGYGLANMQTRAHTVSDDVDISSVFSEGTTVLAWVPRNTHG